MSSAASALILVTVIVTAFISGIFGMAGGLILMAVLAAMLPVATAMVVHGAVQMVSNGYRAFLLRQHIRWDVFARYAGGALLAFAVLFALSWRPDERTVYFFLAATAALAWVPKTIAPLDFEKRWQAELCGFLVQALNTVAGVAGPLLDLFFVKSELGRQTIVATKAITQVLAHAVKIAFWSVPVIAAAGSAAFPPWWFFALAVPLSILGTTLGTKVLERMTDVNFRQWSQWLITAMGVYYFVRAMGWA